MSRPLRVLYVAYPLLTVSPKSAGGAEQLLWTLERELARRGVETMVAASEGSSVSGKLLPTGDVCHEIDDFERRNREHQNRIVDFARHSSREGRFDLIHDMSGSFWPRAAEVSAPLLATLHLPRSFYSATLFQDIPQNVAFNCVSHAQARSFADCEQLEGVVPNGVPLDLLTPNFGPRRGLLWLGRICEEKAPHLALEIARRAEMPLTIAGQVYPFSYHREYFAREVAPYLSRPEAAYVEAPSLELKHRLLREVRALLITSQADETSSVVAMEAAASGTPVIAFARGALPEVVRDGVTGFLVQDLENATRALSQIDAIAPDDCVEHAHRHFSGTAMAEAYLSLYQRLLAPGSRSEYSVRGDKSWITAL